MAGYERSSFVTCTVYVVFNFLIMHRTHYKIILLTNFGFVYKKILNLKKPLIYSS